MVGTIEDEIVFSEYLDGFGGCETLIVGAILDFRVGPVPVSQLLLIPFGRCKYCLRVRRAYWTFNSPTLPSL